MRILFATDHTYMPQRVGGSERSTHDLCRLLAARGHQVAVLCGLKAGDILWFRNRLQTRVRPRCRFPEDYSQGYPVFRGWHARQGAAEVTTAFSPDVAVVQAGEPLAMARAFAELRVPSLVYFRDTQFDSVDGDLRGIPSTAGFVANSGFVAARAREKLGVEAVVIPPLVDFAAFRVRSRRRAITLVNPHPSKGVGIALNLVQARRDIPFEFIECWPANSEMVRLRSEARQLPNITWRRSTLKVARLYGNTRILIVPSQWEEPWGRVVNEAQASGIPVVASNIGGLPESVGRGGILISPHDDPEAWQRSVFGLWDDPAEYARLSREALENVRRPDLQAEHLLDRLLTEMSRLL